MPIVNTRRCESACTSAVEWLEPRLFLAAAPTLSFTAADLPLSLPDNGSAQSTLTAANVTGRLTDVNVTASLTHSDLAQLALALISPSGTRVALIPASTATGADLSSTRFDDQAASTLNSAAAPYTGRFRPASPLALFAGETPNGTWTLEVADTIEGTTGTLTSWSLELIGGGSPAAQISTVPRSIPDSSSVSSILSLANQSGRVFDLNLRLSLTHPRTSDLTVSLTSPSGTRVELFSHIGSGANFTNTFLDDAAAESILTASAPYSGTFRPTGLLSSFAGENPNGNWTLQISDDISGSSGTLNNWSLSLTSIAGMGEIGGVLFDDRNGNGQADAGENPLAGRTVYLDSNGNGQLDTSPAEPSTPTDSTGTYRFYGLAAGSYSVRQQLPSGWIAPGGTVRNVTLSTDELRSGESFASASAASVSGTVYEDRNLNGRRDASEPLRQGTTVYLDRNGNGTWDSGEPIAKTNAAGAYRFSSLLPGQYVVRFYLPKGLHSHSPGRGYYRFSLTGGQSLSGYNFALHNPKAVAKAELDVLGIANNSLWTSPSNRTDFGTVPVSRGQQTHTLVLQNLGQQTLKLTGNPLIQILGSSDFKVVSQPARSIAPGASTSFGIVFDPSAKGVRTATVVIASNDPDEKSYRFTIRGTGV